MNWYLGVLKKYAEFSGRARRREYWFFVLFNIIVSIVLVMIDSATGTLRMAAGFGLLSGLYSLAVLIPSLAVAVRRLHDTNRTGWWLLLAFIPLIGAIILIVFFATEGTSGNNDFGPNPKAAAA